MKRRDQSHRPQRSARNGRCIEVDVEIAPEPSVPGTISELRNIAPQETPQGQFLVFKTDDGSKFALNLDCQNEYGFEATMMLQKWIEEQRS